MRIIINLNSDKAAHLAGWRAKAVQIDVIPEAAAMEVLRMITFPDGSNLLDLISDGSKVKAGWKLFINGIPVKSNDLVSSRVKDNVQIHIMNRK